MKITFEPKENVTVKCIARMSKKLSVEIQWNFPNNYEVCFNMNLILKYISIYTYAIKYLLIALLSFQKKRIKVKGNIRPYIISSKIQIKNAVPYKDNGIYSCEIYDSYTLGWQYHPHNVFKPLQPVLDEDAIHQRYVMNNLSNRTGLDGEWFAFYEVGSNIEETIYSGYPINFIDSFKPNDVSRIIADGYSNIDIKINMRIYRKPLLVLSYEDESYIKGTIDGYPLANIECSFIICTLARQDPTCSSSYTNIEIPRIDLTDKLNIVQFFIRLGNENGPYSVALTESGYVNCKAENSEGKHITDLQVKINNTEVPISIWGADLNPIIPAGRRFEVNCGVLTFDVRGSLNWYYEGVLMKSSEEKGIRIS